MIIGHDLLILQTVLENEKIVALLTKRLNEQTHAKRDLSSPSQPKLNLSTPSSTAFPSCH